jgi:NADPH:quinone reductase-like Zn-dependent oxidoreductase
LKTLLLPNGHVVSVNPALANPLSRLRARLSGYHLRAGFVRPGGTDLRQIAAWIEAGHITPSIERLYPFTQAAEAHRHSETGRARGKLVIAIDDAEAERTIA